MNDMNMKAILDLLAGMGEPAATATPASPVQSMIQKLVQNGLITPQEYYRGLQPMTPPVRPFLSTLEGTLPGSYYPGVPPVQPPMPPPNVGSVNYPPAVRMPEVLPPEGTAAGAARATRAIPTIEMEPLERALVNEAGQAGSAARLALPPGPAPVPPKIPFSAQYPNLAALLGPVGVGNFMANDVANPVGAILGALTMDPTRPGQFKKNLSEANRLWYEKAPETMTGSVLTPLLQLAQRETSPAMDLYRLIKSQYEGPEPTIAELRALRTGTPVPGSLAGAEELTSEQLTQLRQSRKDMEATLPKVPASAQPAATAQAGTQAPAGTPTPKRKMTEADKLAFAEQAMNVIDAAALKYGRNERQVQAIRRMFGAKLQERVQIDPKLYNYWLDKKEAPSTTDRETQLTIDKEARKARAYAEANTLEAEKQAILQNQMVALRNAWTLLNSNRPRVPVTRGDSNWAGQVVVGQDPNKGWSFDTRNRFARWLSPQPLMEMNTQLDRGKLIEELNNLIQMNQGLTVGAGQGMTNSLPVGARVITPESLGLRR